ncbi:MAG: PHP domain-containing protein [Syntrophomonadaceae bacterium]|nr:PHP domain-containing protein [Syntrophomonadaceae bacterium]
MYDLHVHTTASDGLLTPAEVIELAIEIGLTGIAITDHDTMNGLVSAAEYLKSKQLSLDFIPGIEINTDVEAGEVHILGYYVNADDQRLRSRLEEIKSCRWERAVGMIEKLVGLGLPITVEEVEKQAKGDLIGRPHIAMALKDRCYVESIKEAFDKYIGQGRPAYVPRYKFPPEEAITLIHQAGGTAVLAHPGLIRNERTISEIIDLGIDGIEAIYPEHDLKQVIYYKNIADRDNLIITGGSDFHGIDSMESHSALGSCGIDDIIFKSIKQKLLKNK